MRVRIGTTEIKLIDGCRICAHHERGGFEPQTGELWSQFIREGSTVIDVGAYTGPYAIAAAAQGAVAFAYEPNVATYARLKANVAMNGMTPSMVAPFMVGASDVDDPEAPFFTSSEMPLTSAASFIKSDRLTREVKARTVTLDGDMIYYGKRVNVIKIDVEGTEDRVLRGAAKLLERDRPELIVELLNYEAVQKVLKVIAHANYQLVAVLDGRNYFYTAMK